MSVSFGGLSSGMDTDKIIASLLKLEQRPIKRYQSEIEATETTQGAFRDLNNRASNLMDKVDTLANADIWEQMSVNSSDSSVVSASVNDNDKATSGTYEVYVEQLASQARLSSGKVINDQVTFDDDADHDVDGDPYSGGKASKSYYEVVEGSEDLDLDSTSYLNQLSKSVNTTGDATAEWEINDPDGGAVQVDLDSYNTVNSLINGVNDKLSSNSVSAEFGYDSAEDKFYFQATDQSSSGGTTFELDDLQGNNNANFLTATGVTADQTVHSFSREQSVAGENVISADASANLENVLFTGGRLGSSESGSFTVAGETISWDASSDSINSIVSKINDSENGVSASYSDLSDKITLQTENTGTGEIQVEDQSGNLAELLNLENSSGATDDLTGNVAADSTAGQSAKIKINGETVTTDGNTVETQGLTLNLKDLYKQTNNSGDPIQITVEEDTSSSEQAVSEFVDQYNSVIEHINKNSTVDVPDEPGEGEGETGPFVGDSTSSRLKSTLNRMVTSRFKAATPDGSDIQSMADIGVETVDPTLAADQDVGKLQFNSAEFQTQLDKDETGVRKLFNADTVEGDSADGVATQLESYLGDVTDSTNGLLPERIDGFDTQIENLQERIKDQEERVLDKKEYLEEKFLQMEKMMAQLNKQQQALSAKL